jgi:hypothetical protein
MDDFHPMTLEVETFSKEQRNGATDP